MCHINPNYQLSYKSILSSHLIVVKIGSFIYELHINKSKMSLDELIGEEKLKKPSFAKKTLLGLTEFVKKGLLIGALGVISCNSTIYVLEKANGVTLEDNNKQTIINQQKEESVRIGLEEFIRDFYENLELHSAIYKTPNSDQRNKERLDEIVKQNTSEIPSDSHNAYLNIEDRNGERVFSDDDDIVTNDKLLQAYRITVDYVRDIAKALDKHDVIALKPYFHDLISNGVSSDEVVKLSVALKEKYPDSDLDWYRIFRSQQLGVSPKEITEFSDTKKPNALVVFPISDYNKSYERDLEVPKKIKEMYDTNVIIAGNENDVYNAISETPNIELLYLSGHGNSPVINLGSKAEHTIITNTDQIYNEELYIDINDKELPQYLSQLSPNATIFLNSCSTAEGGKDENNLANFVIDASNGRKVIAATDTFSPNEKVVNSVYPFDVRLYQVKRNKDDIKFSDVTYP